MKLTGPRVLGRIRWQGDALETRFISTGALRLGGRRGLTVPETDLPDGYRLVRFQRGKPRLRLAPGMLGVGRLNDAKCDLRTWYAPETKKKADAGVTVIPLAPGDLCVVTMPNWNGVLIEIVCSDDPVEQITGHGLVVDRYILASIVVSFLAHTSALTVVAVTGKHERKTMASSPPPSLTRRAILAMPKPPPPPKVEEQPATAEKKTTARDIHAPARTVVARKEKAKGVLAALKKLDRGGGESFERLGSLFTASDEPEGGNNLSIGALASAFEGGPGVGTGSGRGRTATGGGGLGTRGSAMLRSTGGPSLGARRAAAVGGTVKQGPKRALKLQGGLDRAEVLKVINQHMGSIRNCYERALLARPELEGKLTLEWAVGSAGQVTSTRVVSSSIQDQGVANCIMTDIRRWKFPSPVGGKEVTVVFPFIFNSSGF